MERGAYADIHAFVRQSPVKPDLLVSPQQYYSHFETGIASVHWDRQWRYAVETGLAAGKRVWGMYEVPNPGELSDIRLGPGYCLGDEPLAGSHPQYLYEVRPCAER